MLHLVPSPHHSRSVRSGARSAPLDLPNAFHAKPHEFDMLVAHGDDIDIDVEIRTDGVRFACSSRTRGQHGFNTFVGHPMIGRICVRSSRSRALAFLRKRRKFRARSPE
jgi:hypothetical protein